MTLCEHDEARLAQRVADGTALALTALFAAEQAATIEQEIEHEFDGVQGNWDHEGAARVGIPRLNAVLDELHDMIADRRDTDVEHGAAFDELRRGTSEASGAQ